MIDTTTLRERPAREVRLADLLALAGELPAHKRAEVEASYVRAMWFAAGWVEATEGRGNYDREHGFAVAYTLDALDFLGGAVHFRDGLVSAWERFREAEGVAA